jgi:hypothetical protein
MEKREREREREREGEEEALGVRKLKGDGGGRRRRKKTRDNVLSSARSGRGRGGITGENSEQPGQNEAAEGERESGVSATRRRDAGLSDRTGEAGWPSPLEFPRK